MNYLERLYFHFYMNAIELIIFGVPNYKLYHKI